MREFEFINTLLRPLAHTDYADALRNDAARLPGNLVITTDTLNEGVHFLANSDPALLGRKALRTNLSDLAAMGATPVGYLLNLSLPNADAAWLQAFTEGLAEDQHIYHIGLLGGDTTRGPLSITITAIGEASKPLMRCTAQVGDDVYVTGTMGNAALGLLAYQNGWSYPQSQAHYDLPEPPVFFAQYAATHINAALDISDGLLQDAGHLATESNIAITLQLEHIPLASEVQQALQQKQITMEHVLTGGDEYQLLFTAPRAQESMLQQLAQQSSVLLSRIGKVTAGEGVQCLDATEAPLSFTQTGWQHF
ncbi:MAG: thiamine-phosphate kinase [Rickettsiales bacterium]|nr:thiamine-phosphate kinase [Rickettsiales bacterium]|tara:strand:+ start:781 stop:1704 length:924 start_codon:yes stop_codon:yes gene_type:complete